MQRPRPEINRRPLKPEVVFNLEMASGRNVIPKQVGTNDQSSQLLNIFHVRGHFITLAFPGIKLLPVSDDDEFRVFAGIGRSWQYSSRVQYWWNLVYFGIALLSLAVAEL